MKDIIDFLSHALPWIAIGLFVAISCVREKMKKEGTKQGKLFGAICWTPALCFLFAVGFLVYSVF